MEISNRKDIRLIGRAIHERWPVTEEMRERIISALVEVVESRDPKMMLDAADKLLKADKLNIDRESLYQRQAKDDDDRRIQLLELAQRIPTGELIKLASSHGIIDTAAPTGRSGSRQKAKGKEKTSPSRSKNPRSKRTKPKA